MKPKWTQHDMEMALQAVVNGMPKREAANTYNIPWGTFACKLTGRRKNDTSKHKTYLTPQEEADIAKFIKDSSELGFGLTKPELLLTVKNMLDVKERETKRPKRKVSRKVIEVEDSDTTSEDETQMVLDDTSDVDLSDEDFNLLLNDTFEIEKAIAETESRDTRSIAKSRESPQSQQNPSNDRSLWDTFSSVPTAKSSD